MGCNGLRGGGAGVRTCLLRPGIERHRASGALPAVFFFLCTTCAKIVRTADSRCDAGSMGTPGLESSIERSRANTGLHRAGTERVGNYL